MVEITVGMPKGRVGKIIMFGTLFTISLITSILLFANVSNTEAYTYINFNTTTKSVVIEVPAEKEPSLANLNTWTATLTDPQYDKIQAVSSVDGRTIQSDINNDHQTFNFEKISFQSGTPINKIDLIATAMKAGPQNTKMSLTFATGGTLSDLPLGGIPMTRNFEPYPYPVDLTSQFSLTEINTWLDDVTGNPITFGVAQNTDGKKVLVDKVVLRIDFTDNLLPSTTAKIGDNVVSGIVGGQYPPGTTVTLTCDDPVTGSGVDVIVYSFDGGLTNTIVTDDTAPITLNTPGANTITYHCEDLVDNREADKTLQVTIQAATVTIYPIIAPIPWKELLTISGITQYTAPPGDKVSVDWGDGTTPDVWDIDNNLTWDATHTYGPGTAPGKTITATVVNGGKTVSLPDTEPVTLLKRDTTISLKDIDNIFQGANVYVRGNLLDAEVGEGGVLSGRTITFASNNPAPVPAVTLDPATTGAIEIFDDSGITQGTCGADPSIVLNGGAEITVPGNPVSADIVFCDSPATFNLSIEGAGGSSQVPIDLGSSNPPPISDASGIKKITIGTLPADTTVEIFTLAGRNAIDQELFNTGFSSIAAKLSIDGKTFFSSDGIFAQKGTGPNIVSSGNQETASFGGDNDYNAASPAPTPESATKSYNVDYRSVVVGGGGIGNDVTVIADIGDIITFKPCDADTNAANDDTDYDGICDSFESLNADGSARATPGIPYYSGATSSVTQYFVLDGSKIGVKDIFVDIDGFNPHVNSGAVDDVKMRFNTGHNMNLRAILSDTTIAEVTPINIWRDTDTLRTNDYDSLKADYFGSVGDRATFTGSQTNSGTGGGVTASFSGLYITTPTAPESSNSVRGTITLKMKLNLNAEPPSTSILRQTGASCTGDDAGLNIADSDIASTFANGASNTQKILTTKIKFKTSATVSNLPLGNCAVTMSLGGFKSAFTGASPVTITQGVSSVTATFTDATSSAVGLESGSELSSFTGATSSIVTGQVYVKQGANAVTATFTNVTPAGLNAGSELSAFTDFTLRTTSPTVESENVSPVLYTEKQLAMLNAYRHVLFAHSIGGPSGRSEVRGNDAVIALGAYDVVSGHAVGSRDQQAGTLMHELGHLFNLDHGGPRWLTQPFANGAVTIKQGANTVTGAFSDVTPAGLNAGSELSGFSGATSSIVDGQVTIAQGTETVTALFTNVTPAGLNAGSELDRFVPVVNPPVLPQSGYNCKPNYASVMNYGRQLATSYLDTAAGGGAGGWKLDYSNGRLPNLSEITPFPIESDGLRSLDGPIANGAVTITQGTNAVTASFTDATSSGTGLQTGSELSAFTGATSSITAGKVTIIQGTAIGVATFTNSGTAGLEAGSELTAINVTPRIVWGVTSPSPYYKTGYVTLSGLTTIPLDWSGNGAIATPTTRVDLNNLKIFGCQASVGADPSLFEDGNDWTNMDLSLLGSANFGDGYYIDDIDDSQQAGIERSNANYIVIPPPSPDGTETRNPKSALPIKIDLRKLGDGSDITTAAVYAEYYTDKSSTKVYIGAATYDPALGHYQIPWKLLATKGTTYFINVYVDLPPITSLPPSEFDKTQDRFLNTNTVNAIFTNSGSSGLEADSELSTFTGATAAIGNGPVTITQGTNTVNAIFTNSGSSGLQTGSELSGFSGATASIVDGPVTITQALTDGTVPGNLITIKVKSSS